MGIRFQGGQIFIVFNMDNFFLGVLMLVALVNSVHGKCDGGYWCCGGDYLCGQGEGDCDNDNECLPGLKCDFDGWWGRDYCKAGPNTRNYAWEDWEDLIVQPIPKQKLLIVTMDLAQLTELLVNGMIGLNAQYPVEEVVKQGLEDATIQPLNSEVWNVLES